METEKIQIGSKLINMAKNSVSWRLIYSNGIVIDLFESDGYTYSDSNIEEFTSEQDALDRIKELGLKYTQIIIIE